MSYTQNNPLSRKNSPLNKDDQWIQKATADIKKRGTEGVCTGDKFGGPTCPPGSKRYNLAKTFKKMAKDRKGGPSRESSEEKYMPIEDDMHKKGEGDMGMSRKPYGGNKGDEKRSVRDYEGVSRQPYGGNKGDEKKSVRDYEGPSRKSSSPLNNTGITGLNYSKELQYMPIEDDMNRGMSRESSEGKQIRSAVRDLRKANRKRKRGEYSESTSHHTSAKETYTDLSDKGKAKAHKKMGRTLGYGKQWVEAHGEGPSRESSSPLNTGSWAYEDAKRAEDLYEKGDYAHARALGIDEHDADYAKHWHKDEAEHGVSRKSRSERLRDRAMRRSERSGAEWGDYDYEDKRVQKMLSKASELDERSGNKYDKKGADIGRFLGRMTMTKKLTKAKPKSGGPR